MQSLPSAARWSVLLAASIAVTALLQWVKLPAAFLLGPAAAALMVQTRGGGVIVPRFSLIAAQAVLGCLVAHTITPSIVDGFLYHWPSVLGVLALSITASIVIGWIMGRFRIIPGSTPIWGMLPGGATVMMVMAEAYGADGLRQCAGRRGQHVTREAQADIPADDGKARDQHHGRQLDFHQTQRIQHSAQGQRSHQRPGRNPEHKAKPGANQRQRDCYHGGHRIDRRKISVLKASVAAVSDVQRQQ